MRRAWYVALIVKHLHMEKTMKRTLLLACVLVAGVAATSMALMPFPTGYVIKGTDCCCPDCSTCCGDECNCNCTCETKCSGDACGDCCKDDCTCCCEGGSKAKAKSSCCESGKATAKAAKSSCCSK